MSETAEANDKLVLCPYCGHAQFGGDRCQVCQGLFEPLSRRATQIAMGPWYIRDKNNPFRPGCSYDIIKKMAQSGNLKSKTVMRGPTTKQFWSIARNVPGVSHLIGYCYQCGAHVSPMDSRCGVCSAVFTEVRNRNELGLAYKTDEEAARAQGVLEAELRGEAPPPPPEPGSAAGSGRSGPARESRPSKPGDLLAEVLDLGGDLNSPMPAPRTPGPVAASKPTGASIEFAPSAPEASARPQPISAFDDVEPTGQVPSRGGISPMVWALLAANLLAVGLILFFLLK
ncbi:MAG: hypothetical protein AAGH88_10750 [Planctomycetota bacterium]